jgi:hypothetical protein
MTAIDTTVLTWGARASAVAAAAADPARNNVRRSTSMVINSTVRPRADISSHQKGPIGLWSYRLPDTRYLRIPLA